MYLVTITPRWSESDISDYVEALAKTFLPKYTSVERINGFYEAGSYPHYVIDTFRLRGYPDNRVLLCLCGDEFKHLDNPFAMRRFINEATVEAYLGKPAELTAFATINRLRVKVNGKSYLPKQISVSQEKHISTVWLYDEWDGKATGKLPF